jgi:NAD(P)-dependent dehydrogenase (short-subunit alcohol dehydrogenase family)
MKLAGKLVVVTGAGSGIGRATALAFANEGARVVACDVDQARLDALAAEISAIGSERLAFVRKVDVSDRAQMAAFADEVHTHAPAADVVINNAGVACGGSFLDTSLDDWDWLLGVNLRGVIHGCHFFLPQMVARGAGGHVLNVSSILGLCAAPSVSAYCASKFAVLGFSKSLRVEMAPHGIGVTAICPGLINTAIVEDGRKGADPSTVARAMLDAVRTNPEVRTVGRDAWALHALTRVAPRVTSRLGSFVSKRFGASP